MIPVDYEIWTVMQCRVYQTKVHSMDELKRRMIDVWYGHEQFTVILSLFVLQHYRHDY